MVSKRSSQLILSKKKISNSKCHKQHKHKEVERYPIENFLFNFWLGIESLLAKLYKPVNFVSNKEN